MEPVIVDSRSQFSTVMAYYDIFEKYVLAFDHPAASNITSTEIDALLAADEDAALVLEPENCFIPASFKTV